MWQNKEQDEDKDDNEDNEAHDDSDDNISDMVLKAGLFHRRRGKRWDPVPANERLKLTTKQGKIVRITVPGPLKKIDKVFLQDASSTPTDIQECAINNLEITSSEMIIETAILQNGNNCRLVVYFTDGSHAATVRFSIAIPKYRSVPTENEEICKQCHKSDDDSNMLLCDSCNTGFHIYCLQPPLPEIPSGNWYCNKKGCRAKASIDPLSVGKQIY